jgi:macrodomain Ter protein organizer (MatP/YcbG family)
LRSASDAMRLVKQAQSVRGGLPKAVMFLSRAVKKTRLKEEAIALLNENPAGTLLKSIIHEPENPVISDELNTPIKKTSKLMDKLQAESKEATKRFTVDLKESTHRKLSILAAKTGRTKADIVRLLLDETLEDTEE